MFRIINMERLKLFFNPKSVALIGATENTQKVGGILAKRLLKFKGKTVFVNNHEKKVFSHKTYKSLYEYERKIDLIFIATPKETVISILKQAYKKNIKNIVIYSSGFKTKEKIKIEKYILKLKQKGFNILGPNTRGFTNLKTNFTFSSSEPKSGNVVFISQSGALGSYVMDEGFKLRAFVDLGDTFGLKFYEVIKYFLEDKKTKEIYLHVKRIPHGKEFIELCKKSKKKIYVVKSVKGERAHSFLEKKGEKKFSVYEIYKNAFLQAKVKEVDSVSKLFKFEKEKFAQDLSGRDILIITNSSGSGELVYDLLEMEGFRVIGPVDVGGDAKGKEYVRVLSKIKRNFDEIVLIFTPQAMLNMNEILRDLISCKNKEKLSCIFLGKKTFSEPAKILKENGIKVHFDVI